MSNTQNSTAIFDTTITDGGSTYRLSLDEETDDGSVRVYWNRNGAPVRCGWEGLPQSVRVTVLSQLASR
jgi:hypothetical protein